MTHEEYSEIDNEATEALIALESEIYNAQFVDNDGAAVRPVPLAERLEKIAARTRRILALARTAKKIREGR